MYISCKLQYNLNRNAYMELTNCKQNQFQKKAALPTHYPLIDHLQWIVDRIYSKEIYKTHS